MSEKEFIKKIKKKAKIIKIIRFLIIIIFLLLWELLTYKNIINPFIYSSPIRIYKEIKQLIITNNLFIHIFTTIYEVLISFILGISLGFIIAIILYLNPTLEKIIDPFLTIINSLPKVALGPIIIIIAGANQKSIIVMALLINLIVSIISIYSGFINTDKLKIKMFNTFNASKKDILFKLVIPGSINNIISSLKITISLTLIGVITGEFLVSKKGIGYLIIYGTQVFNLDLVFAGILILLIISYILYKIVMLIEKKYS